MAEPLTLVCGECGGEGVVKEHVRTLQLGGNDIYVLSDETCSLCRGEGRVLADTDPPQTTHPDEGLRFHAADIFAVLEDSIAHGLTEFGMRRLWPYFVADLMYRDNQRRATDAENS